MIKNILAVVGGLFLMSLLGLFMASNFEGSMKEQELNRCKMVVENWEKSNVL